MRTRSRRRGKYGAIRTKLDGFSFDSRAEARRYSELKLMQMAGAISGLSVHPVYVLQDPFKLAGKTIRGIAYEADFEYLDDSDLIAEDVKGIQTEVFKIKRKMFLKKYPHIELRLIGVKK